MNWIAASMRRPITVLVAVVSVLLGGWLAVQRMRVDILPELGVPVVYVAQPYGGMDPAQVEGYITYYYEYHFLYVTGIEHVESRSIQGTSLIKLFFHPGTNMPQAIAETIAQVNRARAFMPPGTVPPFVMRFDAGSVPVGNLVFSSESRSLGEMQDLALNRVRPEFTRLPGVSAPPPFGGSQRTVVVNVNPERLRALNMSPDEVVKAVSANNTISPSGAIRLGNKIPMVPINSVAPDVKSLETIVVRNGAMPVLLRDVGEVKDASDIPTGYALVNGRRTVYIPVTKRADASTLQVVQTVRENLPKFQSLVPEDIKVTYEFDQSPYVTRALNSLTTEGLLGALLTGIAVLIFLRDWRSAIVVVLNIPIALISGVVALWLTGQTLNIMTLGGLALAVGILVDEATVSIENIHSHLDRGARLSTAVYEASLETATPRLLSMLCILAVFVPSFFMIGVSRALFVPLSLAVGFAMISSYVLSSVFVPVLCVWMLRRSPSHHGAAKHEGGAYSRLLRGMISARWVVAVVYFAGVFAANGLLFPGLGSEIFPTVDTGQLRIRMRGPTGTRIEKTEQNLLAVLSEVDEVAGKENVKGSLAFLGVQASSYPVNTIHLWTSGPEEAVAQIQLKEHLGRSTDSIREELRAHLSQKQPELRISFEPADIVGQVMSFGSPTPIEVAISGPALADDQGHADKIHAELAKISSLRDLQFGQSANYPTVAVTLDRQRAGLSGVTVQDVARSLVAATSSSRFTEPNYWADPKTGIAYQVQVQIPTKLMESREELLNLNVTRGGENPVLLRNVATLTDGEVPGEYVRYNTQRMLTLTANVVGEDLGSVGRKIRAAVARAGAPPKRVSVAIRGQLAPMEQLFEGLQSGLLVAVLVIFLLLAANFQSIRLSLVVLSTVPAVLAGSLLALRLTGTTLNIQSFQGAIMAIGVSVANGILLVTFAERARVSGSVAGAAALTGASGRLRAITMTSVAMIAGMIPLALGLGEGGQQSSPLGRAVIGGLAASTLATLFVLPAVFALIQGSSKVSTASLDPTDPLSPHFDTDLRQRQ